MKTLLFILLSTLTITASAAYEDPLTKSLAESNAQLEKQQMQSDLYDIKQSLEMLEENE